MDAFVQLALIEKSKRVFLTDDGVFLSFPLLSPLTFSQHELASLATPASAADYAAAADFARTVNFLPRDMVASVVGDNYLWDVYADVLGRADVARGSAGTVGSAGGDVASLLYEIAEDGTRSETASYRLYRQYRDAWFVARENYSARKLTGELTDDPEASEHWTKVEEPALRAALAEAEDAWKTVGHRAEIEAALQAERDAALNDPRRRWAEWAKAFNPDIDLLTDTGGGRYAPTGLSPRDLAADTAWLHFDLSASEMASLVGTAPQALKVVLDDDSSSAIEHVSFDYRSVSIVRPWFRDDALTSRIWRSSDPELSLSDGGNPPSGACPAYARAIVFVRNLQVFSHAEPAKPSVGALRFTIAADRLTRRDLRIDPMLIRRSARAAPTPAPGPAVPALPVAIAAQRAFRRLDTESLTMAATRPATPVRPHAPMIKRFNPRLVTPGLARNISAAATETPSPAAPAPAPPVHGDDISILAFICRRLPKTPDPIASLNWD